MANEEPQQAFYGSQFGITFPYRRALTESAAAATGGEGGIRLIVAV